MPDWIQRWFAGTLFGAQILLLAVVPSADARLEADALQPHASEAHAHSAPSGHASEAPGRLGSASALHASHPTHDHFLCDLCRALSVIGGPAPAPERAVRTPHQPLAVDGGAERLPAASAHFLPLGPRAPPLA